MALQDATLSHRYLVLSMSMITCLIVLINVSFKIIIIEGLTFSATSVLSPIIAILYLHILKHHNIKEQRWFLNQSLVALYVFSMGVYLLINLPPAEFMHGNRAYQVVFDDIPKKFFAATLAFGLSFYLPHLVLTGQNKTTQLSMKTAVLLALIGGTLFFSLNFIVLFSEPLHQSFNKTFIDSFMITLTVLLLSSSFYLLSTIKDNIPTKSIFEYNDEETLSLYHALVGFSVIITLICFACEYRLVSLYSAFNLKASSILFPLILMLSTLTHEMFGAKANLRLIIYTILADLIFNALLIGLISLPSPSYFNLTYFYKTIMPQRMIASALTLCAVLLTNNILLSLSKRPQFNLPLALRFLLANIVAIILSWTVNETILFSTIYPKDLVTHLALSGFLYKLSLAITTIPIMMILLKLFKNRESM